VQISSVQLRSGALVGALIVAAAFIPPRPAGAQEFTSPRNADVDVRGARRIHIEGAAGLLRVEGRAGATQVKVRGTAATSRREWLDNIKLIAELRGGDVFIKADIPDNDSGWNMRGDNRRSLDLVIEVPTNLPLEVVDGSGEATFTGIGSLDLRDGSGGIEVRGAKGTIHIIDGSGGISVRGVEGDVTVEDGSGGIEARDVTGNFTVSEDGSGNIDINGVGGTMRVKGDGSGDIDVERVAGDFIVDSDGGGSIRHDTVKGKVTIPERRRRRGN